MIRTPALLTGLVLALVLSGGTLVLAWLVGNRDLLPVLLPTWAAWGGYVAARWAERTPVAPGLAVGLLCVAVRMGLGLGFDEGLFAFAPPSIAIMELIAATTGGIIGVVAARRAAESAPPKPKLTPS